MLGSVRQVLPSLALAVAFTANVVSAVKCAERVHLIAARGQGTGDDWNVLVQLRDPFLKKIKGSTAEALPYPHGGSDKIEDVHAGAELLKTYIEDYHKSCPNTKIVTFGYSLVRTNSSLLRALKVSLANKNRVVLLSWKPSAEQVKLAPFP